MNDRTQRVLEAMGRSAMLARVGEGLTQRNLEALTGVDQSTICRFENGRAAGLRIAKVATIIAVLRIDRFDRLQPTRPSRPSDGGPEGAQTL